MAASVVLPVAQWIGSLLMQEASTLYGVEDEVQGLRDELELMQQYLLDADAKQEVGEIRALIGQIRKLAYDAEDVIDTYIFKVQASGVHSNGNLLMRFAHFLYRVPHIYEVGKQVKVIQSRLKGVTNKLNSCGVRRSNEIEKGVRSSHGERQWRQMPRSYPYDDDEGDYVVGLEKDIGKLVEVLMGEGKNQVNVLSFVGMGGSGKTTLAKKLYNHPYAKECFDCMAWVFVSQEWSTRHILSEILRKVGGPKETTELHARLSAEELVDKLRNILEKKSYLVVLDDVWRREALEEILPALPRGNMNRGSNIIITTRNREIIQIQNLQLYVHEPRPLNEEEGWELFSKIAFSRRANFNIESFEGLGKEMLEKCDGLPLAIVALAGILNTKGSIREWQQVKEAVRSRVMEGRGAHTYGRVGDLLALSYDDLPSDLKPCFLYLGIFPEDCQIPVGMLTRMWIAEGLVTKHDEMSLEDVATQRLEELSHRFMIQVVRTNYKGEIKTICLHDLLHDLCVKKAKEQSFLQIYTPLNDPKTSDLSLYAIQPRRAALHSCVTFPTQASRLRSLVLLTRSSALLSAYVYNKDTLDLGAVHHNFKLLRLLNLWGFKTPTGILPVQIGSLIHLRYLGIRATNITELPASLGNLRNLLTLDYRNVEADSNFPIKIPNVLCKLVQLRHLFLPMECPWSVEDLKLSTMKNLGTVWGIKQEGGGHWLSREVPKLSPNLKKLKIVVSTEKDLKATFQCPGLMSDGLHTFHCELRNDIVLRNSEAISHCQHLHKLILIGKIEMEFSLLLPTNLVTLELKDSILKGMDPMRALGALHHLKLLKLSNSYMGTTFACEMSSFPQLEELRLQNLQNLDTWRIEKGAMLCLKKLEILQCRKLQFPQGLAFITALQRLDFFGLPEEFDQKAKEYGWSDKKLRLIHNCEAIIEQSDTPVDVYSLHKLYKQLTAGIFLNSKKKKFWVVRQGDRYYNCFTVCATDLFLATEVDVDGLPKWNTRMHDWEWTEMGQMAERDGALIKVAKLKSPVLVLDVRGEFSIQDLTPYVTYTVAYVIMLDDSKHKREMSAHSILKLPDASIQRHSHKFNNMPRNVWLQVCVGEFETSLKHRGGIEFVLHCQWRQSSEVGFAIKGVNIEPKL